MEEAKKRNKEVVVRMDNHFTECPFKYTQEEMDLLFFIMSIIRKDKIEYDFSIQDVMKVMGKQIRYDRMRETFKSLSSRPYEIIHDDENWSMSYLFTSIVCVKGNIHLSVNKHLIPMLCDLKKKYTSIQLASGFRLNGKYSKRLYMLLARWKNVGGKFYETAHLMEILQYERKDTSDAAAVFRRTIARAVEDINRNTELEVGVEWQKIRQKISGVKFSIKKNRRDNTCVIDFNTDVDFILMKDELMSCGVSEEYVRKLREEGCTVQKVREVKKAANDSIMKNPRHIDNPGAYLLKCFRNEGFLNKDALLDRNEKIEGYRKIVASGTPVEMIKGVLEMEGISLAEILK